MFEWLGVWPAFLGVAFALYAPGLVAGAAFRLRGLALAGAAPAFSTGILAVAAIGLGVVGIPWNPWTVLAAIVVACGAAWLIAFLLGRPAPAGRTRSRAELLPIGLGLAAGIVLIALRMGAYIGAPDALSQTNDAIFHLNVLRFIAESGSASSFDISGLTGGRSFYPAAWHGVASFAAQLSGSDTIVTANVLSLVLAAVVWPIGIAWMTGAATKGSATTIALAAVLASTTLTFPYLMFEWGVVYPYALSLALAAPAVALLLEAPGWRRKDEDGLSWRSLAAPILLILVSAVGIALAQPSTLLTVGVLGACAIVGWCFTGWRAADAKSRMRRVAGAAGSVAALAIVWVILSRGTSGSVWGVFQGRLRTAADVLFNGQVMLPFLWGVSILMLIGIVVAVWRPRLRWIVAAWIILSALYAVAATIESPALRNFLLGAWYGDPYRLAALAPLTVVPLAAIGAATVAWWASRAIARRRAEPSGATTAVAIIAAVCAIALIVAPVVQMRRVYTATVETETRYQISSSSFLSEDERSLLERLDQNMPEDAIAVGNPSTGIAFAYGLADRDVYPRTWAPPRTDAFTILTQELRDAAESPAVCDALEEIGATYVIDFGPGVAGPGRYVFPAMSGFESVPGFELVDSEGEASLWRITACG